MKKYPPSLELINAIGQALYNKKAQHILALDVRGLSSMTDYFVIAEGTSPPHLKALKKEVMAVLDKEKIEIAAIEGEQGNDWVVVDCWQVVIHLFTGSMRERYGIERVWQEGKIIKLLFEKEATPNLHYGS